MREKYVGNGHRTGRVKEEMKRGQRWRKVEEKKKWSTMKL